MSVWFRGVVIATALVTAGVAAASVADASLPKHAKQLTVHAGHTVSNIDASLTQGGAISGQVTDVDSNPLSNAQVEVLTAKGRVSGYTSTDSNGEYRAVGLPPSTKGYAVCVSGTSASSATRPVAYGYVAQCNGSTKAWSGFQPPSDARFIPTAVGQASTANLILVDGGALTGTVTSRESGKKVDANGSLFSTSGRGEGGFSVSHGVFTASSLAPGKYVVCFAPDTIQSTGYAGSLPQCYRNKSWLPGTPPPAKATTVTVTSGAATEVDQSLPVAAAITGKVRDAKTHSATSAAVIEVYAHGKTVAFQTPDSHGTYDVQDLPVETVDVCAFPSNRMQVLLVDVAQRRDDHPVSAIRSQRSIPDSTKAPETGQCWKQTPWNGKGSVPGAARELQLHRNVTTSGIDLTVTRMTYSSHIGGHVRGAAGGLRGAGVTAYRPNGTSVAYTTSGKGGAYRLSLPASTKPGYIVCAASPQTVRRTIARRNSSQPVLGSECWRQAAWDGSGPPPTSAPRVTVASGHTASGIDITLPETGAIAGTVTYQAMPVPNLSVEILDRDGDFDGFGQTNAQGQYKVTGLSPAPGYLVCFSTEYTDVSTLSPVYGLRPQCYSNQPWDGSNY